MILIPDLNKCLMLSFPIHISKKALSIRTICFYSRGETSVSISGEFQSRDFHPTRHADASESKSVSARKHLEIH